MTLKGLVHLLIFLLPALTGTRIFVDKSGDSVVDPDALTILGNFGQAINGKSFQQDALVSHGDFQYIAYYDSGRHVCLGRRNHSSSDWEIIRFTDYDFKSNDAHNTISMGICPKDGTIHLAFDHHGHPLHYRVSKKGAATDPEEIRWTPQLFGKVTSELEDGKPIRITYPRFWQTPDGKLQFCYRRGGSGNGDRMLVDYDPEKGKWINTRQIDSGDGRFIDEVGESDSRCSYPNGYGYDKQGILHATWVWRESSQGANHDLVYVYSKNGGRTWINNNGEEMAGPPHVNSPGIIAVPIKRTYGLMNTHGQAVDSRGNIHVIMWHCSDSSLKKAGSSPGQERWGPPQARRYFHYRKNQDGSWNKTELPWVAGTRPKVFIDNADNIYLVFTTKEDAPADYHVRYSSEDLIVAAATADSGYTDWKVVFREKGPFVNEILGDYYRWKATGILSLIIQEYPEEVHQPTPLRVIDLDILLK